MSRFSRIFLIVLDGVGCGEAPDADEFGDKGSNTLGNLAKRVGGLTLPNLESLGIGNTTEIQGVDPEKTTKGAHGSLIALTADNNTTTGHWEIAGVVEDKAFPKYPNGFPEEIIKPFEEAVGRKVLWNKPASGTAIIDQFGEEHMKTGNLILYTSADSVFQIAAHEEIVPLEELYTMCKIARKILDGKHKVARIIARPFIGEPGNFTRTSNRHDYSVIPPRDTILDQLTAAGLETIGVGKISDIFATQGVSDSILTKSNDDGMEVLTGLIDRDFTGLTFVNLVDFDSLYGHRRNCDGFHKALEDFDSQFTACMNKARDTDLFIITADHGNDPTWEKHTDHTRERAPIIIWHKGLTTPVDLGDIQGFWAIAQSIAENFELTGFNGAPSFMSKI